MTSQGMVNKNVHKHKIFNGFPSEFSLLLLFLRNSLLRKWKNSIDLPEKKQKKVSPTHAHLNFDTG